MDSEKIPGDRLILALISSFRLLVLLMDRKGLIEQEELIAMIQQVAAIHRETGDPNNLADAMHALSIHLMSSPDLRR